MYIFKTIEKRVRDWIAKDESCIWVRFILKSINVSIRWWNQWLSVIFRRGECSGEEYSLIRRIQGRAAGQGNIFLASLSWTGSELVWLRTGQGLKPFAAPLYPSPPRETCLVCVRHRCTNNLSAKTPKNCVYRSSPLNGTFCWVLKLSLNVRDKFFRFTLLKIISNFRTKRCHLFWHINQFSYANACFSFSISVCKNGLRPLRATLRFHSL